MSLLDLFGIGKQRKEVIDEALASGAMIVDVRTASEYSYGHAEGSINVPLDSIESRVNKLKKLDVPLLLCCASGMRSGRALAILKGNGLECYNAGSWKRFR